MLTSALDGDEWLNSLPGHFTPGNEAGTRRTEDYVGPTAGVFVLEKRKISLICLDSNPGSSSPQSGQYCDYHRIPTPHSFQPSSPNMTIDKSTICQPLDGPHKSVTGS
jgi:hypothetical protein